MMNKPVYISSVCVCVCLCHKSGIAPLKDVAQLQYWRMLLNFLHHVPHVWKITFSMLVRPHCMFFFFINSLSFPFFCWVADFLKFICMYSIWRQLLILIWIVCFLNWLFVLWLCLWWLLLCRKWLFLCNWICHPSVTCIYIVSWSFYSSILKNKKFYLVSFSFLICFIFFFNI